MATKSNLNGGTIAILLLLVAMYPIVLLWSLETIFHLAIGLSWKTYLAAWGLIIVIRASTTTKKVD